MSDCPILSHGLCVRLRQERRRCAAGLAERSNTEMTAPSMLGTKLGVSPRISPALCGIASSLVLSPTKQRLQSYARSPTRRSETYFAQ
jgi:hypothetical protein